MATVALESRITLMSPKTLDLQPLSVDPGDKLATTWAWVKKIR